MPNSEPWLPIRRCVCADVTFEELWSSGVRSIDEAEAQECGVACGLCRPFLLRMIDTGETAFAID